MDDQNVSTKNFVWAIVQLMGHVTLAGRLSKPDEYGGLWQIDVPYGGDEFETEFFGNQAVFRIQVRSEEIARAYAHEHEVFEYNAPIVTRDEHENAMQRARDQLYRVTRENEVLRQRLTAVNALPAKSELNPYDEDDDDGFEDEDDEF